MNFAGEVIFKVSDISSLDINFRTDFMPTKIVKKGDVIALNRVASRNIWQHKKEFIDHEEYIEKLDELLEQLNNEIDYVKQLEKDYEFVEINIYIRSDFAQIGYSIPSPILEKLSQIGCTLNFDILSYGMAVNKGE